MNVPGKHGTSSSHNESVNGLTISKATYSQTTCMPEPQAQSGKPESGEGSTQPWPPASTQHAGWMCDDKAPFRVLI